MNPPFAPSVHGLDKHGRILADVLLSDGTNVNYTLVKEGWCWWYRKYAPCDRETAKRVSCLRLIDLRNEPAHNPARQRTGGIGWNSRTGFKIIFKSCRQISPASSSLNIGKVP